VSSETRLEELTTRDSTPASDDTVKDQGEG